jgi:RNA polymerase sigma-70 factor (ECF subfamily)
VATDDKQAFVSDIERQHGRSLRRYLASRLRNAASDVPDLVQEVFLRLLRIEQHETIRSPEAYLITIATHVLHQHAMRETARPEAVDLMEATEELDLLSDHDPIEQADVNQRIQELERVLRQLSPKARAALILHRRDGYSVEEIGAHLKVSRAMAKKYLAQALAHCRKRIRAPAQDIR